MKVVSLSEQGLHLTVEPRSLVGEHVDGFSICYIVSAETYVVQD